MDELVKAIATRKKYNSMDLNDFVKEYEIYSDQIIPKEVVDEFRFTGLNNIDFITCGFLEDYGLRGLS